MSIENILQGGIYEEILTGISIIRRVYKLCVEGGLKHENSVICY